MTSVNNKHTIQRETTLYQTVYSAESTYLPLRGTQLIRYRGLKLAAIR